MTWASRPRRQTSGLCHPDQSRKADRRTLPHLDPLTPAVRAGEGGGKWSGRVAPTAIAAVMVRANGRKHSGFGQGERNHLFHDPQDEFGAGGDVQLLEQAVQVGVSGIWGNS